MKLFTVAADLDPLSLCLESPWKKNLETVETAKLCSKSDHIDKEEIMMLQKESRHSLGTMVSQVRNCEIESFPITNPHQDAQIHRSQG